MTREEQLKQAIEENLNKHRHETILNFDGYKKRVNWILQDPSILRHGDPEIMKQAGWVREEEWVSVEDRLPDTREWVIVYTNYKRIVINFMESGFCWDTYPLIYEDEIITHWKPLPQPPKQ